MGSKDIDAVSGQGMGRAQDISSLSRSFRSRGWAGLERVLLVEPDDAQRAHLCDAVRDVAHIDGYADFVTARTHLLSKPCDWLVTNGRLGAYNGLHLVLLAGTAALPIRSLVYSDRRDLGLAREAQRFGAFHEFRDRVDLALPAYLRGSLPPQDRRNPMQPDRHATFRGGRRCTDSSTHASA